MFSEKNDKCASFFMNTFLIFYLLPIISSVKSRVKSRADKKIFLVLQSFLLYLKMGFVF